METVYFGGGTPSRLEPWAIARLLDEIGRSRAIVPNAEITLEANPDDVSPAAAAAWRGAGVNRVSLGAQTFDPSALQWMHRTHAAGQIAPAVDAIRSAGIADVSLDLIFGLPASLGRDWGRDLDRRLRARSRPPLALRAHRRGPHAAGPLGGARRGQPGGRRSVCDGVPRASHALAAEGFEHYEVSNAARPGHRARHNSAYWRRAPFVGLGPSAHSGFGRVRQWNIRDWAAYERASTEGRETVAGERNPVRRGGDARGDLSRSPDPRRPGGGSARCRDGHGVDRGRLGGDRGRPGPVEPGGLAPPRCPRCFRYDVASAISVQDSAQRRHVSAHDAR